MQATPFSHRTGAYSERWADYGGGYLRAVLATAMGWLRNRSERRRLARLDDSVLRDIGLCRGDVDREYARPFWQPVDYPALTAARLNSGPRFGARRR